MATSSGKVSRASIRFSSIALATAFAVMSAGINIACERATTLSFDGGNPPKFVLTGSGSLGLLRVRGPEKQRDALGETAFLYWMIEPTTKDSDRSVEKIGSITYGQVPSGYTQVYPEKGEAPSLIEGKIYNIRVSAISAPGIIKDFTIRDGKITEVR
jgi:hypothetical protein